MQSSATIQNFDCNLWPLSIRMILTAFSATYLIAAVVRSVTQLLTIKAVYYPTKRTKKRTGSSIFPILTKSGSEEPTKFTRNESDEGYLSFIPTTALKNCLALKNFSRFKSAVEPDQNDAQCFRLNPLDFSDKISFQISSYLNRIE